MPSLNASVLRLLPRAGSPQEAVRLYRSGDLVACADMLRGRSDFASVALRARALNRLDRPAPALEYLDEHPLQSPSHRERGEEAVIKASALIRLGELVAADAMIAQNRPYALSAACAPLEAEVDFIAALICFARRDFAAAENGAHRAMERERFTFELSGYFVPLETTYALSLNLLGTVAAAKQRYVEQAAYIRAAFETLERGDTQDSWLSAWLLANLSFLVRDLDFEGDARLIRENLRKIGDSDDLRSLRFHILRSLGWCNALRGDHLSAFRDLRHAASIAPSSPLRILAALDRAFLARELHEGLLAREELEAAADLSARVDWKNCAGEGRIALLLMAQEMAAVSPTAARDAFDRYMLYKPQLSPLLMASFDPRTLAAERYAGGVVSRAEGQSARATSLFTEAFEIYGRVGYRWRAAMAAIELAELTGEQRFIEFAAAEAGARPNSWLARRAATLNAPRNELVATKR